MWNNSLCEFWNLMLAHQVKWNKSLCAAAHFTLRSNISLPKAISQIPQGIYFVEKGSDCITIRAFFWRRCNWPLPTILWIAVSDQWTFPRAKNCSTVRNFYTSVRTGAALSSPCAPQKSPTAKAVGLFWNKWPILIQPAHPYRPFIKRYGESLNGMPFR